MEALGLVPDINKREALGLVPIMGIISIHLMADSSDVLEDHYKFEKFSNKKRKDDIEKHN